MPEEITNLPREQTTHGKVKRNLHYWIAAGMAILIIIVMVITNLKSHKTEKKKPVATEAPPPPQLNDLRNTITQQEQEAKLKPPLLPPALPTLPQQAVPPIPAPAVTHAEDDDAKRRAREDAMIEIRKSAILALNEPHAEAQAPASAAAGTDPMLLQQLLNARNNGGPGAGPILPPAKRGKIAEDAAAREEWERQQEQSRAHNTLHADPASSPYILFEGSILPAVLITEINSEIPGMVTAQVYENVYDSVNGNTLVIPQGTRLIGTYNTDIEFGQERLQMAFHRLIYPSGASVELGNFSAADGKGQAGLHDKVNTHMLSMLTSSLLLAKVAGSLEQKYPNDNSGNTINFSTAEGGSNMNATGQILFDAAHTLLDRYRNRPATLVIRQGYRFNVMVAKDLDLPPPVTARRW